MKPSIYPTQPRIDPVVSLVSPIPFLYVYHHSLTRSGTYDESCGGALGAIMQVSSLAPRGNEKCPIYQTHSQLSPKCVPQVTNIRITNNNAIETVDQCNAVCEGRGFAFANFGFTEGGGSCTCSEECLDYETSNQNTQAWALDPVRGQRGFLLTPQAHVPFKGHLILSAQLLNIAHAHLL